MPATNVESVYFNDGCVKVRDYIYIATKLHSLDPDEYEFSRMYFMKAGRWAHHDLEWNVRSVCYRSDETFCALSLQGDVHFATASGFTTEKIPEAGTRDGLGAVKQIREIEGMLYVCGDQGQVYRREKDGWVHFDAGLLDRAISASAVDLNSIDGTGPDDLYVVGFHGRIFHRDPKGWRELDSPTNYHLERVRCVSRDEVYVCGNNGSFFRGNKDGFRNFSVQGMEEHFWGLECFQGKVYLASLGGLFVFDGTSVSPLDTKLTVKIGGYRLDARDGVLWSFGVDDLACFDGKSWATLLHPDNP